MRKEQRKGKISLRDDRAPDRQDHGSLAGARRQQGNHTKRDRNKFIKKDRRERRSSWKTLSVGVRGE